MGDGLDLEYGANNHGVTRYIVYHDSAGNFLKIWDTEDDPIDPAGMEITDFLNSDDIQYDGPGDWTKG